MTEHRESVREISVPMSTPFEKRRSGRVGVTIPVRVEGIDPNGETVEYEGHAHSLNRHGARIEIPWPLDGNYPVRVWTTLKVLKVAKFRVVPMLSPGGENGEFGVECLDANENFWGIEFPASDESEEVVAKVLLECRGCRTLALLPLTIFEIEALRLIGRVGKPCPTCQVVSPWRYADVIMMEGRPNWTQAAIEPRERGHRRVYMQLSVEVRDPQGGAEVAWTENVSRCGFCFASAKEYVPGEIIHAVFPLDPLTRRTELPARIVRGQSIAGSDRKLYGAIFEARTISQPLMA